MFKNKHIFIILLVTLVLTLVVYNQDLIMVKKTSTKTIGKYETATLAGGCFWCMESAFELMPGIIDVTSGYSGGKKENPTYEEVSSGTTGHRESIQIKYDPSKISYQDLIKFFWKQIDPTNNNGQFVDKGSQYKSAIFYHSEKQKRIAEETRIELEKTGKFNMPIVTEILPFTNFYPAEEYHQDYYKKNVLNYNLYKKGSGRDNFLKKYWNESFKNVTGYGEKIKEYDKPNDAELRKMLTPLQYKVTQKEGTENPFDNEYWDNKRNGIYIDIVSGEPLFSSKDKFDSGTGWPSFTKPLEPDNIIEEEDNSLFMKRIEVRSKKADSHLGHLFNDGPNGSQRYCMNSAALRFIPEEDLEKEGYGEYKELFENK